MYIVLSRFFFYKSLYLTSCQQVSKSLVKNNHMKNRYIYSYPVSTKYLPLGTMTSFFEYYVPTLKFVTLLYNDWFSYSIWNLLTQITHITSTSNHVTNIFFDWQSEWAPFICYNLLNTKKGTVTYLCACNIWIVLFFNINHTRFLTYRICIVSINISNIFLRASAPVIRSDFNPHSVSIRFFCHTEIVISSVSPASCKFL